jgi:pyruvate,water dikinase
MTYLATDRTDGRAMGLDLHTPNPTHNLSGPNDPWSTINTRENYEGVMSPLAATLWIPVADLAITGTFHDLGVLRRDEIRVGATPSGSVTAVFYGRYTANINFFRRIADLTPGASGAAFEEQIFGSDRSDLPNSSSKRRYPAVAVKAPITVARLPRALRQMCARVDYWWRFATSPEGLARPADVQLQQASDTFQSAMRLHLAGTFVAQGVFDELGRLAAAVGQPELHLELAGGYGEMAEVKQVVALQEVADGRRTMAEFLAEYGFRCAGEMEASIPSWRENPELIDRLVSKYRAASRPDAAATAAARAVTRHAAEQQLLDALPRSKRPAARVLLRLARTFVPLREDGKAAVGKAFDGGRAACGARGRELVEAGITEQVDDVFYLTIDEIRGTPPGDARELIAARRDLRAAYEKLDVPDAWVGQPEPIVLTEAQAVDTSTERVTSVSGVAAAHGVADGRARVLASAQECDDLEPDEILVCRTTDPSWAAAFHLAAGLVIDVGSTSSHGAIVAREMGLPCVIGTGNGTTVLRTGDLLRVDGGAGLVSVLEPAAHDGPELSLEKCREVPTPDQSNLC